MLALKLALVETRPDWESRPGLELAGPARPERQNRHFVLRIQMMKIRFRNRFWNCLPLRMSRRRLVSPKWSR